MSSSFDKNPSLESLLEHVNAMLHAGEDSLLNSEDFTPEFPVVFIVGAPRSGTTLALQWLAATGRFAYPSNLMSRFYRAPYLGALVQRLLTDPAYAYRDELAGLVLEELGPKFSSDFGKTSGPLEPHEFSYFWRRFFPVDVGRQLGHDELQGSDPAGFLQGIGRIEKAFNLPVTMKGLLLQYDIPKLAEWVPSSVFLFTRRDPFFNAQSLLQARKRVTGSIEGWIATRPPQYSELVLRDPYTQVAGQVLFTNEAIEEGLTAIPSHRHLSVQYEEFCRRPSDVYAALVERFKAQDAYLPAEYLGPSGFRPSNKVESSTKEAQLINDALAALRV